MSALRLWLTSTVIALALIIPNHIYAQDGVSNQIIALVNQARASAGLSPVATNTALVAAAQRHSNDMAATENLSHTGSDGSQFWQRIADAGYGMSTGGENVLYRWDTSAAGAFGQWQASPPHNANMMNPDYYEIGVAWAQAPSGAYYFTMVLASRPGASAPSPPQPTAVPPTPIPPTPVPTNAYSTNSDTYSTNTCTAFSHTCPTDARATFSHTCPADARATFSHARANRTGTC
jgi:hypothetical protein